MEKTANERNAVAGSRIWQDTEIEVVMRHGACNQFPNLCLSLSFIGTRMDCDTIVEQGSLAREIAALLDKRTRFSENGGAE